MPALQEEGGVCSEAAGPLLHVQGLRPSLQREGPMISIEHMLVAASILLLLSVLASKASAKLGIPALLMFLVLGMLAGSDGPGGIYFDNALIAQSLGVKGGTIIQPFDRLLVLADKEELSETRAIVEVEARNQNAPGL